MNSRNAGLAALITAILLLAHALFVFTKYRWVTGLVEVLAAGVLLWQWQIRRTELIQQVKKL